MEGWLARPSREGLAQDDSGKVDDEEDWGRIGDDGGGGQGQSRSNSVGGRIADRIGPIIRLVPGLKRRDGGQWHPARQVPPLARVSEIINNIVPSIQVTRTVPGIDEPLPTTELSLPSTSTSSVVETPTAAPAPSQQPSQITSTPIAQSFTTIVSTITVPSNATINPEHVTLAPITNGNTVIIFTTHMSQNKTSMPISTGTRTVTVTQEAPSTVKYATTVVHGGGGGGGGGNWNPDITQTVLPTASTTEGAFIGGGDDGNEPAPVQPRLLGGIFGGVAGIALIVLAIFMLFKRHKRLRAIQALDDAGYGGPMQGPSGPSIVSRSISFIGGAAGARHQRSAAASDPEPAERGFVKVAGRKLPPALGGLRPEFGSMRSNAQSSSSYTGPDDSIGTAAARVGSGSGRSSHNVARQSSGGGSTRAVNPFHSPPSSPPPTTADFPPARRPPPPPPPPPPRSPATSTPALMTRTPPPPPPPRLPYNRQLSLSGVDGVGRSLASHDGSRGSRFTEDIA